MIIPFQLNLGCSREWALFELQGNILKENPDILWPNQTLGELVIKKDTVTLEIGHHLLTGKIEELKLPYAIIKKTASVDTMTDHNEKASPVYQVEGIAKKRIVFNTRPKSIIASTHITKP